MEHVKQLDSFPLTETTKVIGRNLLATTCLD